MVGDNASVSALSVLHSLCKFWSGTTLVLVLCLSYTPCVSFGRGQRLCVRSSLSLFFSLFFFFFALSFFLFFFLFVCLFVCLFAVVVVVWGEGVKVSLTGAATSIVFVATNTYGSSRQ